jgi:D-3-phosphoglycerate dehydrogenase
MSSYNVVIAEGSFGGITSGAHDYHGHSINVKIAPFGTPAQVKDATADAHGVIVGLQRLHRDEIAALGPNVRAISRGGIGLDNIDLDAAKARSIAVIHQPVYATDEVATHAIAMLLALNRRLMDSDRIVRTAWAERRQLSALKPLHRMTVGVIGLGAIGRAAAHKLLALVGKVVAYDPFVKEMPAGVQGAATLDELLKISDAITLHAPLTPQTRNLIGARELALLPEGAVVINVARGELMDHDALIASLRSEQVAAAGLDVFPVEPLPIDHPLLSAPNVLLSPHTAFASTEAVARLKRQTVDDIFSYLAENKVVAGRLAVNPAAR